MLLGICGHPRLTGRSRVARDHLSLENHHRLETWLGGDEQWRAHLLRGGELRVLELQRLELRLVVLSSQTKEWILRSFRVVWNQMVSSTMDTVPNIRPEWNLDLVHNVISSLCETL